jgi:hypothetical protein
VLNVLIKDKILILLELDLEIGDNLTKAKLIVISIFEKGEGILYNN